MSQSDKPLVWLRGQIKTPPFSRTARVEAGYLLRRLQKGELVGMPHSRPLPAVGPRCHELRVRDAGATWRVVYRLDRDAVVIVEVFSKKSPTTPAAIVETAQRRLREYDRA